MIASKYGANKLKELRIKRNLSQEQIGKYLNVAPQTISRYESGKHKMNIETIYRLALYFKVPPSEFFPKVRKE